MNQIVAGLLLGYAVFIAGMLLGGLDEDDRLVAGALGPRVLGVFRRMRPDVR